MLIIFFFLFTISCNSKKYVPNNYKLNIDRKYILEDKENSIITDIAIFQVNDNETISITSRKDGSCKLFDTTGKLLWHYIPDWKLIDTFLAVLPNDHDMKIRMNERGREIFDSKKLIERQIELHGEIDENVWSRFLNSYKHSVEGINYNKWTNTYYLLTKVELTAKEAVDNKINFFQMYQPLIIQINEDLTKFDYIPIINYYIDSLKYTKVSSDILTIAGLKNNLSIFMHVSAGYHPIYSQIDPKKIKFYSIAEIDINSNERSYGAIMPDKNIEYKVFQNFSNPLMIVDENKELWYVFPINDTLYNYQTHRQFPLQFEVNNDEFYQNFSDDSDFLSKAQRLNFMVEKISITKDNDILVYTRFPKRDGNKHSGTSLIQVYDIEGNLKKQFRYYPDYFQNFQVHGVVANRFNVDEVIVITGDEDYYYINYCKWSELK